MMEHIEIMKRYNRWLKNATADAELIPELEKMSGNEKLIEDAFYCDLAFGTGGLRGVIGAGSNRINVYTVAKASKGLADYVNKNFPVDKRRIAISYDSRIKSDLFAKVAAGVFAYNGLEVYIYSSLMPTPCLSYAVRSLDCSAGVMITASHNPAKYNGYKAYGPDGCQITAEAAEEIFTAIERCDEFSDTAATDFEAGLASGAIKYIPDEVYTAFTEEVKKQSMLFGEAIEKNAAIVYSPLNGSGLKPVLRALRESGFDNISVVPEQEQPNGNFPTCPYPNPEIREAMQKGIELADKTNAELLLATDPDCDRVGIAVRNSNGELQLLSGNETGMLLLDYICSRRSANGAMPENPVMIKTIVTIDMAERIASRYGVRTVNVLTGFKFIGEQIALLEKEGVESSYIFGFEESYGYLSGTYVRDKDAVNAAFLICEMFAYYKSRGITLSEKLSSLYEEYGYCLNTLHSYEFDGIAGFEKMQGIMQRLRENISEFGEKCVKECLDYSTGINGLPRSDVIKFVLEDNCSLVVRPSGTEPKLKLYISVSAVNRESAEKLEKRITASAEKFFE